MTASAVAFAQFLALVGFQKLADALRFEAHEQRKEASRLVVSIDVSREAWAERLERIHAHELAHLDKARAELAK